MWYLGEQEKDRLSVAHYMKPNLHDQKKAYMRAPEYFSALTWSLEL